MPWVRVDDEYAEHPKLASVGPLGQAMWLAGLAYCNRNHTDGFIPWATARTLVSWEFLGVPEDDGRQKRYHVSLKSGLSGRLVENDDIIELLVYAGLWDEADGGYTVHDYADYQPTGEQATNRRDQLSAIRAAAGRAGGLAKKQTASKTVSKTEANGKQNPSPVPGPGKSLQDLPGDGVLLDDAGAQGATPTAPARGQSDETLAVIHAEAGVCPFCRLPYTGSYLDHTAAKHRVNPEPGLGNLGRRRHAKQSEPIPADVQEQLDRMEAEAQRTPEQVATLVASLGRA